MIAVNKPAGWLTQPAPGGTDSLEHQAKAWVKRTHGKPGAVFLEAVHRLDRPVSGVVLFARTSKALRRCQQAVRDRQWTKTYLAVVRGWTAEASDIDHPVKDRDRPGRPPSPGRTLMRRLRTATTATTRTTTTTTTTTTATTATYYE